MIEVTSGGDEGNLSDDERRALELIAFDTPSGETVAFPEPGARLGDFTIEREIGRGGMSVVYRARQESLGRAVALKVTPEPTGSTDSARVARLEREARILGSLRHEGIVAVHAAGAVPGFRWVAMDLVEGTTLREIVAGRAGGWPAPGEPGRIRRSLGLLHRVARALAAAHEIGVVHRDVKPENVVVDRESRPVLVDFGLARGVASDPAATAERTRGFVGTPRYASPEQARGESLTPASDVFSFGLVAFETLTGAPAFDGSTSARLLEAIEWHDAAWPKRLRLPRDVRAVVEKCLEKRPSDRYADARELEADFARLLRLEPVTAVARGSIARFLRRCARRPRRVAVAVALSSFVVAAVAVGALIGREGTVAARRAEARARFEEALRLWADGDLEREEAILRELVESGDPPPGACGRLADMRLREGDPLAALGLYRLEIARGGATTADRIGSHLAEAGEAGGSPPPDPAAFGEVVTARDHALAAFLLERRGERDAAIASLDRAVALEPSAFEWRLDRARLLARARRNSRAAADFRLARDMAPLELPDVRAFTGVLFAIGRFEEAESLLRAASSEAPGDVRLLASRSLALLNMERGADAVALVARALGMAPDDPFVIACAAVADVFEARVDDARERLLAAQARHPGDPNLAYRRAAIELDAGHLEDAEAAARIALDDPTYGVDLLAVLTNVLEKAGRADEAAANYPILRERDPENPAWPTQHGHALTRAGRFAEAEAAFREAIALDASRPSSFYGLGWVLRRTGRFFDGLKVYEGALGLDPDNGVTHYWIADGWVELGRPEVADLYLDVALAQHPTWFDAWALRGVIRTQLGDLAGAEAAFRRALEIRPRHAPVAADLGDILDRNGKDGEALSYYRLAREIDPKLPTAWCGEGILRLDSDDPAITDVAEAILLLERAVELRPDDADYRAHLERARARDREARARAGK